ncbi:MAG TPA: TIGR03435 family protein [Terriglobales bacterium]|nr:TIGR03435 family protein [Terriglobales bacterium]
MKTTQRLTFIGAGPGAAKPRDPRLWRPFGAAILVVLAGCALAVTQQAPRFEAATLKPDTLHGGVEGGCHGIDSKFAPDDPGRDVPLGRCVITAGRLSHLMSIAYAMPLQRFSGFPDWDGPHRFDVEAEADNPSTTTEAQLLAMLRAFLTDRFQLKVHSVHTEAPGFALVVGKHGPKLHPSAQEAASAIPEFTGSAMILKGYSMADLAQFLSSLPSIGRPVRDMTGLRGRYDLTLNIFDNRPGADANMKSLIGNWQSAISDVQDQLGLKFESDKTTVDKLIIDYAQLPRVVN